MSDWYDGFMDDAAEISASDAIQAFKEISVDFQKRGPFMRALAAAREDARLAVKALVICDPFDTQQLMRLQNDVRRYVDLVLFVRSTIQSGELASEQLSDDVVREVLRDVDPDVD